MNCSELLSLLALVVGFTGSVILAWGAIWVDPQGIASQAATTFDYNPARLATLAGDAASGVIGFLCIAVAFALELISKILAPQAGPHFMKRGTAIFLVLLFAMAIFFTDRVVFHPWLSARNASQAKAHLPRE